jgi:hypothetical protein
MFHDLTFIVEMPSISILTIPWIALWQFFFNLLSQIRTQSISQSKLLSSLIVLNCTILLPILLVTCRCETMVVNKLKYDQNLRKSQQIQSIKYMRETISYLEQVFPSQQFSLEQRKNPGLPKTSLPIVSQEIKLRQSFLQQVCNQLR